MKLAAIGKDEKRIQQAENKHNGRRLI